MFTAVLIDTIEFAEGLRWHNDKLWFCDLWAKKVYCYDNSNQLSCELCLNDEPVSLGWLSDGSLLVTSLMQRQLLQIKNGQTSVYADLAMTAPGFAHDFIVSANDDVYISTSGFYPAFDVTVESSSILLIKPDKSITVAAENIGYPNGIQLIDNDSRLIVAETFAAKLSEFAIDDKGLLHSMQTFHGFDTKGFQVHFDHDGIPIDLDRYYPDGICYDKKRQVVWVACPGRNEIVAINRDGIEVEIKTQLTPFDCTLGGKNLDRLYIGSSNGDKNNPQGMIEYIDLA